MRYTYIESDEKLCWKDGQKQQWHYGHMEEGMSLFGDVRKKNRLETSDCLVDERKRLIVEPCQKKIGFFEKVRGYIPCQDEEGNQGFVRIIEKSRVKLFALLMIMVALLGGLIWGLIEMSKPVDDTPIRIASGEMTNPNPENIRLPGIERIYADAGDTHVNQLLLNVEGNAYNLKYTIQLKDSGEVLYESKVIEPGYGVREFDMNRSFEAGEYPIVITVNSSALEESGNDESAAYNAGQLEAMLIVE